MNKNKIFKVSEEPTNRTFSNHLENYIDQYNVNLTRNINSNNVIRKEQNNFISIAWLVYIFWKKKLKLKILKRDVFDFVLETYKIVLIRGIQQAIANNLSESAHSFLEWIISRTNNILQLGKGGIFPLVVTTLLFKLIKSKPPQLLSYQDVRRNRNEGNSIMNGQQHSEIFNPQNYNENENIIWIPIKTSNIPTISNQRLLLE